MHSALEETRILEACPYGLRRASERCCGIVFFGCYALIRARA